MEIVMRCPLCGQEHEAEKLPLSQVKDGYTLMILCPKAGEDKVYLFKNKEREFRQAVAELGFRFGV